MNNLYETQSLNNYLNDYLNDGITHGKKISYGSLGRNQLGRNQNEIPQQSVNSERDNIIMNSERNSKQNSNKTNILQHAVNYVTGNHERPYIIMNSKPNSNKPNKPNILQHTVNYVMFNPERHNIIMNSKPNSNKPNKPIILQQPVNSDTVNSDTVNYETQPIMMNSKLNSNKNDNKSKINVTELLDKKQIFNTNQKHVLLQKLTEEEDEIWKQMSITLSDIDIYLAENNASRATVK